MAKETELQGDAAEITARQPGGIASGALTIGRGQQVYRGSMHLELQKFGGSSLDRQIGLFDQQHDFQDTDIEVTGLDLSVSEDRVLSALQILLDRTNYNGNRPGQELHTEIYQGTLPRLAVSYADFFAACGLEPGRTGHHKREQDMLKALHSLAEPKWRVCYTRHRYVGKGKNRQRRSDVIRWTGPLLTLEQVDYYQDLDDSELERVQAGHEGPPQQRQRGLVVLFSSLLVDQLRTFHVLKPTDLHQEIRKLLPRAPRSVSLFVEWLLTLQVSPYKISKEKMIAKLRLDDLYHRQRQKARVEKQIMEAIEVALELQYLTGWQQDATGIFTFHLNPERCHRLRTGKMDVSGTPGALGVFRRAGFSRTMELCRKEWVKTDESHGGMGDYKEYRVYHPVFGTGKLTTYDLKSGVDGVLIAGTPTAWYEWSTLAITMYA